MGKVTGIGGVFFKSSNDHKSLAEWYSTNLGMQLEDWGARSSSGRRIRSKDRGLTVWHVAERDTKWFSPSASSFMINYRVDNMAAMLVPPPGKRRRDLKGPESDENGTFAWVMDPDGNKVELWEPASGREQ